MRRNLFALVIEDIDHKPVSYAVVAFVLCVGIFCGAFYPAVISETEAASLGSYLTATMRALADTSPKLLTILLQSLWNNARLVIIIAVAGFTRFGSPFLVIAEFVKGFGVGLSFSAVCHVFGGGGAVFAFFSVVPQNLLYLPAYLVLGAKGLDQSVALFRNGAFGKGRYAEGILPCLYAILAGILLESLLIPYILKLLSSWYI